MNDRNQEDVTAETEVAGRRDFLGAAAAAGAVAVAAVPTLLTGCGDDGDDGSPAAQGEQGPNPDQDTSPVRWGFLMDLNRCVGCRSCTVACKTENDVRIGVFRASVRFYEHGEYPATKRDFVPWVCNHCADPPCIKRCPTATVKSTLTFSDGTEAEYDARATYQRPDGLVHNDVDLCTGCGKCVVDCPYGVRYLDPVKKAGGHDTRTVVDKCTWCNHRLQEGLVPSCVNTCAAEARMVGNLNDPNSEISKLIAANDAQVLNPEAGTEPRCYYIGLNAEAYLNGDDAKLEAQAANPKYWSEPAV